MAQSQSAAKAFDTCVLFDGKPCPPCQKHIELQAEILAIRAQILAAERAILELENRQQHLRTEINCNHDPITSRLPSETVLEIFKLTLVRRDDTELDDMEIDSPLFLGAVCRSWRNIAWSSPTLWNWIHISLRSPASENLVELVQNWLDRSAQLPLTFYISGPQEVFPKNKDCYIKGEFDGLIHAVNQQSIRWKNIHLASHTSLIPLFCGDSRGAPNLQTLTLDPMGGDYDCYFQMDETPHPSQIKLRCCPLDGVDIAWNHLTTVYADDFYSYECIELVQKAPQLVRCRFIEVEDKRGYRTFSTPDEAFVHLALQSLDFASTGSGHEERESFFDNFTFPHLISLSIRILMESLSTPLWERSIKPFITRSCSQGRLSSLVLQCPCQTKSLAEVLQATPLLVTLELDSSLELDDDGYEFFSLLARTCISKAPDGEDGPLDRFLPNLRRFHYREDLEYEANLHERTILWPKILDIPGPLSEIRSPHRRPLDTVLIEAYFGNRHKAGYIDPESLQRALDLIDAGINLAFKSQWYRGGDMIRLSMKHHATWDT